MSIAQLVRNTATQDEAVVRAQSSITPQQTETLVPALQASSYAWGVQTIDDYDGYMSVLIEPRTLGNDMPAYFIAGTKNHLGLLKAHKDDLPPIAIFSAIGDLSAELMGFVA